MDKMNSGGTFLHSVWVTFLLVYSFIQHEAFAKDCFSPLGMEDKRITDRQLRSSSYLSGLAVASYARLNNDEGYGGWCPNQTAYRNTTVPVYREFIQVKLDIALRIKGILLQGRAKGVEKVDRYWIAYASDKTDRRTWKWIRDQQSGSVKFFIGNKHSKLHTSTLRPPIVAEAIRIVPEILATNIQVCLRFELLGCPFQNGLVSYEIPQGNARGGRYNFTDSSYDGITNGHFLYSGLGMLTDGKLGPEDYVDTNGLGWIGWNRYKNRAPYIIFEFLGTRIFSSMTIHCNVRDRTSIKLFSEVEVSFNVDDVSFDASLQYKPEDVSSGSSWMNFNVTVDLCRHIGKLVKLNFTYAGDWILISEVTFNSEPLGSKSPPETFCAPVSIPPQSTLPPTDTGSLLTTSSPSDSILGNEDPASSSSSGSLDGGVIAGIICAVIAVLLAVVLFICWKRYPHLIFQREKPFNSFIKVELKPYPHYQAAPQRVSRLDSTASDNEEKRYSFKNKLSSEGGGGGADVTACPIYASIQENLNKNASETDELNNLSKCHQHNSEQKPKKVKPPIPPPLKPYQHIPDVIYAEPNSPLLPPPSPAQGGSPKPPIPPRASQIDFTEGSKLLDNDYAEPDSPAEKSPTVNEPQSATPKIVSGYAEPIDAISPKSMTTFPNPIYEEVYSEPYQGVSGTSLYCNPDEDLNFRPRLDTFKDFPRHKLHFKEKIGDGQFGEVHIGEAEGLGDILGDEFKHTPRVTVAIKTLKPDVDKNIKDDFFKEVKVMAGLRHSNVIRLLGVCRDDPMCMIVEYMANGDLNQFLKERELTPSLSLNESNGFEDAGQYVSSQALFYMAKQVAAGMKYISSLNYVHRDLATRNCLVGHAYTVKIADFGMSRNLYCKHYYRIEGRVILPIRWMAPECILQGRFTTASDVWAYGVTLWEILTLAKEYPYSEFSDEQVIQNVQKMFHGPDTPFTLLPQPETCPDDLYELMKKCWAKELEERPSFVELHSNMAERVRLSEVTI